MVNTENTAPLTVAAFVKKCIAASGKSIEETERAMGDTHRVRLQLIIDGKIKLPMMSVHRLAQALKVDSLMLLRVWAHDYFPAMEEALFSADGLAVLTPNEQKIIEAYRARVRDDDLELMTFEDPAFVLLVVKRPQGGRSREA